MYHQPPAPAVCLQGVGRQGWQRSFSFLVVGHDSSPVEVTCVVQNVPNSGRERPRKKKKEKKKIHAHDCQAAVNYLSGNIPIDQQKNLYKWAIVSLEVQFSSVVPGQMLKDNLKIQLIV